MNSITKPALIMLLLVAPSLGKSPHVRLNLVEVKKIWNKAPHNAFTDLAFWQDHFYCAFREGRGHVSTDGRIRVIRSKSCDTWQAAPPVTLPGYDLRDAHLSVTPDGRLMLLGGAAPRKKENQSAPTGTFVSFTHNGTEWTNPQIVIEPGRWLWSVTWRDGIAYGVSYSAGDNTSHLDLHKSTDGLHYNLHARKILEGGYPTEVTLRFDRHGICYALARRDRRGNAPHSAMLGVSRGDYTKWQWRDLGEQFNSFGGPNFIELPAGHWIAAGRMHASGAHTALTLLDPDAHTMTKLLKLPSGGDTSYPGLVWRNDTLYVSYYSSHENKTSIYLAKIKVTYTCPACAATMQTVPMLVGLPTRQMHDQLKQGKALLAGCVGNPHNPEYATVCRACRKWKTARMKYWQTLPKEFPSTR